MTADLLAHFY